MVNRKIKKFSEKFDLEDYLIKKKIEYAEFASGTEISLETCPFCKGISKSGNFKPFKIFINIDNKLFNCFLCGQQGNIIKLLSVLENKKIHEIINIFLYNNNEIIEITESLSNNLLKENRGESPNGKEDQLMPPTDLPSTFIPLYPLQEQFIEAYDYINKRGFLKKDIIKKLDIRYCENMKRIIFPIYQKGEILGWQGRDITGEQNPKYLISKNFKKNKIFYNFDNIENTDELIIVEGIIDLVKCPINKTTCLFGKSLSDYQFNIILSMPNLKRIIIAIDPEEEESQRKIYDRLNSYYDVDILQLPFGTDPGHFSIEEMEVHIKNIGHKNYDLDSKIV